MSEERSCWKGVTEMMDSAEAVRLGRYVGYWFANTPRRALYSMSYYKFAAKMIGRQKHVLDVGCSEGLGTWLLAVECGQAVGIDSDSEAIRIGQENWAADDRIDFHDCDFLQMPARQYDAVTNFDVIEHIRPENAARFVEQIASNLKHDGIAIIGTPNLEAQKYASAVSREGHINCYTSERLHDELKACFHHVFSFVANDEVVHTGFPPTANYLLTVACRKRAA